MAELMRVAALTGYLATMRELGIDPRALLRDVGLSQDHLSNPEHLISAVAAIRLLERSAQLSGCITLGLRMAEVRSLADLGATSLLIAHQPTLRNALAALSEFRNRINSTLVLHIEEFGDQVVLREDFSLRNPEPARQASNLALGVLARMCSSVMGDHWTPNTVCFSHDSPAQAEQPILLRLFRCRPEFNSEFNGIVIDARDLDRANAKADTALAGYARQLIETVMSPSMRSASQDAEEFIMLTLPAGKATIQACAKSMGVTVRTLQRMLDVDGVTFSELLNRARMQLSTQYLANPRIRITDVADMLGYGSIGAFTRWHVQNFGMPPREWRSGKRAMPGQQVATSQDQQS